MQSHANIRDLPKTSNSTELIWGFGGRFRTKRRFRSMLSSCNITLIFTALFWSADVNVFTFHLLSPTHGHLGR